jgi:Tfp pilus tip-associated adhesin PilY1
MKVKVTPTTSPQKVNNLTNKSSENVSNIKLRALSSNEQFLGKVHSKLKNSFGQLILHNKLMVMGSWQKNLKESHQLVIDLDQDEFYFGETYGKKYAKHGLGIQFKIGKEPVFGMF